MSGKLHIYTSCVFAQIPTANLEMVVEDRLGKCVIFCSHSTLQSIGIFDNILSLCTHGLDDATLTIHSDVTVARLDY